MTIIIREVGSWVVLYGENALMIKRKRGSLSVIWNFANYMSNRWFTCHTEVTSITRSQIYHWWRAWRENCLRENFVHTAIDGASQCNWRRSCDWKQCHAIQLLLDTDNYDDTWYVLQFSVERNLRELKIKSRGNGRMCPEINPVPDGERKRERERERKGVGGGKRGEERRTRDVHINALAQKAHVRLSLEY